jgi:hypothetical protein
LSLRQFWNASLTRGAISLSGNTLRETTPVFEFPRAMPAVTSEQVKHVGDEENYQNRPQSYAGAAAGTPTAMAVVSSTAAKQQYQNNNEYQHCRFSYSSCLISGLLV